jgi:hypothetical protein
LQCYTGDDLFCVDDQSDSESTDQDIDGDQDRDRDHKQSENKNTNENEHESANEKQTEPMKEQNSFVPTATVQTNQPKPVITKINKNKIKLKRIHSTSSSSSMSTSISKPTCVHPMIAAARSLAESRSATRRYSKRQWKSQLKDTSPINLNAEEHQNSNVHVYTNNSIPCSSCDRSRSASNSHVHAHHSTRTNDQAHALAVNGADCRTVQAPVNSRVPVRVGNVGRPPTGFHPRRRTKLQVKLNRQIYLFQQAEMRTI